MKVILVSTPEGQYQVPLQKVAEHRADYYACEVDGYEKNSPEWEKEVHWGMRDSFKGIDWILNNTDWEDWQKDAIKVNNKVRITDEDFWCISEGFEIIDVSEEW